MLTAERVRELLDYDPETGELRWRVPRGGSAGFGSVSGYVRNSRGKKYRHVTVLGRVYASHRLVWLWVYGTFPEKDIDHINGDGLDNRLCNLRAVSHADNQRNQKKRVTNTSGVTGVTWDKHARKWKSQIRVAGVQTHLGCFENLDDAVAVRKAAELKYGFHPNHGSDRPL